MNQEPQHIDKWKTKEPTNIQELIEKYRPKEIRRYMDDGSLVIRYEPR